MHPLFAEVCVLPLKQPGAQTFQECIQLRNYVGDSAILLQLLQLLILLLSTARKEFHVSFLRNNSELFW